MEVDLEGYVERAEFPLSKPLLPLFEAISNALDAIEDAGRVINPTVRIEVVRVPSLDSAMPGAVESFIISDNGIGFDEENFSAFKRASTRRKIGRGGKGIGRFSWLAAFDRVFIQSQFLSDSGSYANRNFTFSVRDIENLNSDNNELIARGSIIRLERIRERFSTRIPKDILALGRAIVEHFVPTLLDPSCPRILLVDEQRSVELNELFSELYGPARLEVGFESSGHQFDVVILNMRPSAAGGRHKILFTARRREVQPERLDLFIPDLAAGPLQDQDGQYYFVAAFIRGSLLDRRVSPDRLRFALPERAEVDGSVDDSGDLLPEPSLAMIRKEAVDAIKTVLRPLLKSVADQKRIELEKFIATEAPQYRVLLPEMEYIAQNIRPGLKAREMDIALYEELSQKRIQLKKQAVDLESGPDQHSPQYKKALENFLQQHSTFAMAELAQYIVHRRVIINFLAKSLERDENTGYFKREDALHTLIFPMKTTSDFVDYDRHNLWLIDERLEYHRHLSSDKAISTIDFIEAESDRRPDLVVFKGPMAFGEGDYNLTGIVIVEFKRPGRTSYKDDPLQQITDQLMDIRDGKWKSEKGRAVDVASRNAPASLYVVCDPEPYVERAAMRVGLLRTPDGQGWYGVNPNLGCSIEILTYDKLLLDSRKRNRILFERLGLPTD